MCNVVWLRQALAEYQDRLNNVLCVTAYEKQFGPVDIYRGKR